MNRKIVLALVVLLLSVAGIAAAEVDLSSDPGGPGLYETRLVAGQHIDAGVVRVWNSPKNMMVQAEAQGGWKIADMHVYMGLGPIPARQGNPVPGKFPFKYEFDNPVTLHTAAASLSDDLDFSWGKSERTQLVAVHTTLVKLDETGKKIAEEGAWAFGPYTFDGSQWGWYTAYELSHPQRGHFIDAPVVGLHYHGPTQEGVTSDEEGGGGFLFFPGETIEFSIGSISIGSSEAAKKISPADLVEGGDTENDTVLNIAWLLQSMDVDGGANGKIELVPEVVACLENVVGGSVIDFSKNAKVAEIIDSFRAQCVGIPGTNLTTDLTREDARGNLEAGLNASGIFRKNISKTEDYAEDKQKLEVMPVYLPGLRSNGDPSYCDLNGNGVYDLLSDQLGVPYEEWRINGDPDAESCDPRVDGEACVVTLIECREVAKPIVVTYREGIDIYDDQVTTDFWPGRFSTDIVTAVSRDDGTTWKRMNVSRMADLSSFDLETGEPFPGTSSSPYLKIDDNYILNVWESKFCRSGNPRYAITTCDDPSTLEVEQDDPATPDINECAEYCNGNIEKGTYTCEADYPYDDDYFITDIWGVRGQQRSVDYNEVDDVADLGIGEIPYSCLWAARGVIITQKELAEGTFDSLRPEDDPATEEDESDVLALGDIVWFKPERLTSGRRDAYIPAVGSARGAGFAIAWQEDPSGLRPGKGKGPGEGWSGAISNHKTDIWYSFISSEDFAKVDGNFVSSGPGEDPNGEAQFDEKPGLGRPKALVPFALPVRVSDNDMVNVDTLKVQPSANCITIEGGAEPVCFPEVVDDTFVPLDPEEIAVQFCDHPNANPDTCCDPENHQEDPNCEDLKGLFGNLTGTKRFAYLAATLDEYDNDLRTFMPGGDGTPDYQYFVDNGGTLDLCDTTGSDSYILGLPGTAAHERWYGFANAAGASKLVCATSDGRLLDGDVSASRPNIQLQPYTKSDGTKSAWVLLGYEESKGMGHSLAAEEHLDTDNPVDEIIGDQGQDKPVKQDLGKNVIYHSFDFTQPDLVSAGHIVNLPALCGGLYPTYCDNAKTPDVIETDLDNPTCSCAAGQPVPLYFENYIDNGDGTGEWLPDETQFMQYRTEIARRARFIVQPPGRMGDTKTLGAIIYKQGQEGQGRPADVFIRRFVKSGSGNPYRFENLQCTTYLDDTFDLPGCPTDGVTGYNCNVWGEAAGDKLCGGTFTETSSEGDSYTRRDHINLTSADIDLAVDAGPVDDTPDDPTDDRYGTNKVLLWSQHDYNIGDESYGYVDLEDGTDCDVLAGEVCPAMYSNSRSHRGFIRGDFIVTAYAYSPNWAAGSNGNDRYNFYIRKSFDGGQTWTTNPAGSGVFSCPEWRADPTVPDLDGTGNAPPAGIDADCSICAEVDENGICIASASAAFYAAGEFEPARNMSEIKNNKETSSDPRVGATPPVYPLDGRLANQPVLRFVEDEYVDNVFFVAWGTGDNQKKTGTNDLGGEAAPLDLYYTRSTDYGDTFLKVPWVVNGENSNQYGETEWRYQRLAWGEEEQGECQLKATSDGSKAYAIFHQLTPLEEDPDEVITRWYPWEVEETHEDDLWFRRLIFWPEEADEMP